MASATITKMPGSAYPWAYALRLRDVRGDVFYALIEDLKWAIPARERKYDPPTKRWLFKVDMLDAVIGVLKHHNLAYDCEGEMPPKCHQTGLDATEAARTLYVQPDAPLCVVQAAYRALAKVTHPDAGGDVAQMQKVNAAYELLTK